MHDSMNNSMNNLMNNSMNDLMNDMTPDLMNDLLCDFISTIYGHGAGITFCLITWHGICVVLMLLMLKKATAKSCFLRYDICIETLCTTLYLSCQ